MVGGSSKLEGLTEYMTTKLETPIRAGSVPHQSQKSGGNIDFHIEAIGLAMREMESVWQKRDPVFVLSSDLVKEDVVPKNNWKKKLFKL